MLDEHPDWYLRAFSAEFNVCLEDIYKLFKKLGVTRCRRRDIRQKRDKKRAPEWYHGSMTGERLELWFESSLLKKVKPGCAIIMDRASFHRKKQLEEICGKANVHLMFLPAYSPDFNPIEKDWATMKNALRDTAPLCDLLQTAVYDCWR